MRCEIKTPTGKIIEKEVETVVIPQEDGELAIQRDYFAERNLALAEGELRLVGEQTDLYYVNMGPVMVERETIKITPYIFIPAEQLDGLQLEYVLKAVQAARVAGDNAIDKKFRQEETLRKKIRIARRHQEMK